MAMARRESLSAEDGLLSLLRFYERPGRASAQERAALSVALYPIWADVAAARAEIWVLRSV